MPGATVNAHDTQSLVSELAHLVEAFEAALAADPATDFAQFLPDRGHPLYLPALGELIRIDLEHSWISGNGRRVFEYAARHPAVLEQPIILRAVAFEEYRQRRRAGENTEPAEYRDAYGLDTTDWPELPAGSLHGSGVRSDESARTDPVRTPPPTGLAGGRPEDWQTDRIAVQPVPHPPEDGDSLLFSGWDRVKAALPEPGTAFLGFRLVEELGRGAFGRVYLARQGDLAGRAVALKVACDIAGESQTLAQLQHTNIVPIYSFHRVGPFQAVCMPFFGRTTLAHVVRHISDRPTLPSSGKELRSTLDLRKDDTASASASKPSSHDGSVGSNEAPAPAAAPAAVQAPEYAHAPDGWARLEGLSYIEVVLTLGEQLADGLAHAHRRGILHRDLKPANVLLTDDGRPMLLDFNLAEDVKLRTPERASVGGTIPYMAPEHIEAYRTGTGRLDERCDVFSLGVILFELLTGRHPFPMHKGATREMVLQMIEDRRKPAPTLRQYNPAVSPAVESIVRKCLAPDPADRYKSAEDLREDIDRHLNHLPLKHAANPSTRELVRKWARRHPRLASSGTVAVIAAALLVAVVAGSLYAREQSRGLEARGRFAEHQAAFSSTQLFLDDWNQSRNQSLPRLGEGIDRLRGVLARYDVPDDPAAADAWLNAPSLRYLPEADRVRVREDVGEAFYLMAQLAHQKASTTGDAREARAEVERAARWNELARRYSGDRVPRAVREQRAAVAELQGDRAEAERLRREAEATPLESARDLFLVGDQLRRQNRHREALRHLQRATQLDPENFSAWFVRGSAHLALEQREPAVACFTACVSLKPDFAPAWMNRGLAYSGLRVYPQAIEDLDRATRLDPNLTEAYIYRADVRRAEGNLAAAEADYTRALETGSAPVRVYFLRATVRHLRGDAAGAKADREAGFRLKPADEMSWIARAENRLGDNANGALADVDEALALNPASVSGLQLKSHILAERLKRPDDALDVLNRAVELHPDHVPIVAGRGVVLARAGKRDAAVRDAKAALRNDTSPPNLYQVGCIYALTVKTHPEDKREALRLLWGGLRAGFGLDIVRTDTDLDALRDDPDFKAIVKDAEALDRLRRAVPAGVKK
jgi:eukaryotic-like serine/threonine-protein kinase